MNLGEVARRAERLIVDNSPAILTGLAVAGVVTTTLLTAKASFKAARLIANDPSIMNQEGDPKAQVKEAVRLCWTLYIPPVVTGSLTVLCIIGANRIGTRRAAALAAAYTISEKAFEEYREKIAEKLGSRKEETARTEIAQDKVRQQPIETAVFYGSGTVPCFETYTGRYFLSDMETLKKAQNDTNYQILHQGYASVGDFYDRVGLPATDVSEEVGWNSDKLLELEFNTVLSESGRPVLAITYHVVPIRHYYRCN